MSVLCAILAGVVFDIVALHDGVYAARVQPMPPMYVFANALIVIDDEAVTVVDTHQSPSAAEALIEEIRALTDKPVAFVVNTHWHGDHVYGNQVYRRHFPGVVFIGHRTIRGDVLDLGASRLAEELETLPGTIADRASWLATGLGPDGEPLSDAQRERVEYSHRVRTGYLEELRTLELVPPQLTFERGLTLHRPGRTIRLLHYGRAHTRGDVVVHLPDERILAVGDLVEDAFPYFGDAYPSGWADTLEALARLDVDVFVPAHGPVLRDRTLLELESRMLRALVERVAAAVASGKSLEQTQSTVTLTDFSTAFPNAADAIAAAVERAYQEAAADRSP